jgi:hypothetical protein
VYRAGKETGYFFVAMDRFGFYSISLKRLSPIADGKTLRKNYKKRLFM